MFTLIELTLEPSNNKPLPIANGHFIHGLLFKRLSEVDPKYIDKLHDSHEAKPFALVPATAIGKSHEMGDIDNIAMDSTEAAIFRIGVWDNILERMIYQAFRPGDVLYIGASAFVINDVTCIDRLEETNAAATHAAGISDGFAIRFTQPTAFRSSGRTLLFPEARLVFGSLARNWAQATESSLPAEALDEISTCAFPSHYQLATKAIRMRRFFITGFTGHCRYAVDAGLSNDAKAILNTLLKLLPFTGLGYKTTMGLGVAEIAEGREGLPISRQ